MKVWGLVLFMMVLCSACASGGGQGATGQGRLRDWSDFDRASLGYGIAGLPDPSGVPYEQV